MKIINENLDLASLHKEYNESGAVIVNDLLAPDVAELVYEALDSHAPWELHVKHPRTPKVEIFRPDQLATMTEDELLAQVPQIAQLQDRDLSFIYNRITIPTDENEATEELRILSQVFRYFNSPEYLKLMGDITGDYSGVEVSAWASRYDRNHFLSIHSDEHPSQGRIAAHVLGLTKDWEEAWGGNFTFCDEQGKPESLRVPQFNSLVLFKVPHYHVVSQVKPDVQGHRYSLFGWYKSTREYFNPSEAEQQPASDFSQRWF